MPAEPAPLWAVTGTGGYVGGVIARVLEEQGVQVRRLSRTTGFSLEASAPPAVAFADGRVQVLVHCAYDFSATTWANVRRVNVDGSLRLLDAAHRGGVGRIVFVSSLAAYDGCVSLYGRAKREVEHAVSNRGGYSIRPGTVFGPQPRGIIARISAQALRGRLVPVIQHPGALHLVHEDDLAALVSSLATSEVPPGTTPWLAAGERTWSLEALLLETARRAGRRVRTVIVPWRLVWGGLKGLEILGLRPSFRSDSVLSLTKPVPPEQLACLQRFPLIRFRDY